MHQTNKFARTRELVLFEAQNGRALTAIVPDELARQIKLQWNGERADLFQENERGLRAKMRANGKPITAQDHGLRLRFWFEYDRVMETQKPTPMDMAYVLGRGFAKEKFYRYITDPYYLAHLILPPSNYAEAIDLALSLATAKLMDIVEASHIDPSGYVNHHLVEKILKIQESLHAKSFGMRRKVGEQGKRTDLEDQGEETPAETHEQKIARLKNEIAQRQLEKENMQRAAVPKEDPVP